jgi:PAS domain S-box-containing protein
MHLPAPRTLATRDFNSTAPVLGRMFHRLNFAWQFTRWSIAARLAAIVLALAIPLNLMIASVAWHLSEAAKDGRTSLLYTARSVAAAADAKLGGYIALAKVLATSPALHNHNLEAFEMEAGRTFASIPDVWVQVADQHGQLLLNTANRTDQPLPHENPVALEAQTAAFEKRAAIVSDVYFDQARNDWIINIEVPLFEDGQPFRALAVVMRARSFLSVLSKGSMPEGWLAGIVDRHGRFIVRVPGDDQRVGQPASKVWDEATDRDGVFDTVSADGDPIVFANAHTISGWPVSVAVKKAELEAEASSAIRWSAIGGGGLSLLSLLFAVLIARRITNPITELQDNANLVLAGAAPPMLSGPPEVRELWEVLSRSAAHRNRAVDALRRSEARWESEAAALRRLNDASSRLWRARNLGEGLDEMLAASIEMLSADMGHIQLLDPVRGASMIVAHRGFERPFLDVFREVPAKEDSACGRVLRLGNRIVIEDVETDEGFASFRAVAAAAGFRAVQSTPLIGRDGALIGMLSTHFKQVHRPTVQDLHRLDLYARQAADFISRCRTDELLQNSEERFRGIYEHAPTGIAMLDLQGRFLSCNPACTSMLDDTEEGLRGRCFWDFVHLEEREAIMSQNQRLRALEMPSFEAVNRLVRKDGAFLWVHEHVSLLRDSGAPTKIIALLTDMTESKRHEEQIRLLMREVNHRSKNMLALVQAVARQTVAARPDDFIGRFSDRIQALSASQDPLVKGAWRGADLEELTRSQLGHFKDLIGKRIELKGPQLIISVAAAQAIGMAIHELATNASKYGALSCSGGRIAVEWKVEAADGGEKSFAMSWRESGGPSVEAPSRRGFGSTVVCALAEASLNAKVHLDFPTTGLTWRLQCPAAAVTNGIPA